MNKLIRLTIGLVALSWAGAALAVPTFYTDRASFDAANPATALEDFENLNIGAGAARGCPSPLNSASNNACLSPGDVIGGFSLSNIGPDRGGTALAITGAGFGGTTSRDVFANFFADQLRLSFDTPVAVVGLDVMSLFAATNITVSLFESGGGLLDLIVVAATQSGTFFGVRFGSNAIAWMTFAGVQAEGIDNLAFRVPEPGTLALLGLGLLGLGFSRRRT